MDAAGHDSVSPAAAFGQRYAQFLADLEAAKNGPVADVIAAMPIVILVRAAREALAGRVHRDASRSRRHVDAG